MHRAFILGESSNAQTPSSENQQTDTATRIRRDRTPHFHARWGHASEGYDPGAFYKSVYQYVCLHIEKKYGTVIPIPRKKALKTLSVYRVVLTQATLKQIHQRNLYLDIDDPGDKVLAVLEECVEAAEHRLTENLSQKTVDRIWNSIKAAYGGKYSPPDAEIFD